MTTKSPAPPGMPPHLWELAKSDVRGSIPGRLREAVANGANAPAHVRVLARRAAAGGATLAAVGAIAVGAAATATAEPQPDLAGGSTDLPPEGTDTGTGADAAPPWEGLDPPPAMPGSGDGGGTGPGGGGDVLGSVTTTTTGGGDVGSGLGTTWRVQEGGAESDDWLTIEIFGEVTVTETADGMFLVDAYQVIVIRDDDGNEYIFKEHYQVVVPDPPGQETDLVIHESSYVHVVENADGSFTVADVDYDISVSTGNDGDGIDEMGIGQTQGVELTDLEAIPDDDVEVTLDQLGRATSEDVGDEAVGTIKQDQRVLDGHPLPPPPPFLGEIGFPPGGGTSDGTPSTTENGQPTTTPGTPTATTTPTTGSAPVVLRGEMAPLSSTLATTPGAAAVAFTGEETAGTDASSAEPTRVDTTPVPEGGASPDAGLDGPAPAFNGPAAPTASGGTGPGASGPIEVPPSEDIPAEGVDGGGRADESTTADDTTETPDPGLGTETNDDVGSDTGSDSSSEAGSDSGSDATDGAADAALVS